MITTAPVAIVGQWQKTRTICVDISKDSFCWVRDDEQEGKTEYRNASALAWLRSQMAEAKAAHYAGLRIVCEPTAHYHRRLLRLARSIGCDTGLVGGSQVNAMQVVESNDLGKSDTKDPRTMMLLVKMGKVMVDRQLGAEWLCLRELNAEHDRLERRLTQTKNRIHGIMCELFPDLSFCADWLFSGDASRAVLDCYGLDAAAIVDAGEKAVRRTLLRRGVATRTIARVWEDAQKAALQAAPAIVRALKVDQLREAFEDLRRAQARREKVRTQLVQTYETLRENGEVSIDPANAPVGPVSLARIYAETGPMSDFGTVEQLFKYGGMNLRPKESGQMKRKERQSKCGRPALRSVLAQAVLKLVVRPGLYGEYYHARKAQGKPGALVMSAVARKLLHLLYGLEKSGRPYDKTRVFCCQSQHVKAA